MMTSFSLALWQASDRLKREDFFLAILDRELEVRTSTV